MAGNWQKSEYGKEIKEKYSKYPNIHLLEPIYESHEINWIRSNAALYVHGHSAGGTNPSLVEAMNFGLPILAFDCVYNRATTEEKCLYWNTAEDISTIIQKTPDLSSYANNMKRGLEFDYIHGKILQSNIIRYISLTNSVFIKLRRL